MNVARAIRPVALVVVGLCGCVAPDRAPRASDSAADGNDVSDGAETATLTGDGVVEPSVDAEAIMARAFDYETELVKVSVAADPGTHGDASLVHFFVSGENVDRFKTIDLNRTDQSVQFVEGSMFVKEHLDGDGAPTGFTVMYKGPRDYDPESGDWFWGRVLDGEITHQGKVGFCTDCHVDVESTDFVFGLRADNQVE